MAILAGGLLYSTNNARDKGKDARRKDDLKALSTALISYYTDHNKYPPATAGDPRDYVSDNTTLSPGWIPELATYLNKFPKDPLQAGLLAPLAAVFENGRKIAGSSWSWLATNKTTTQKPKGQVAGIVTANLGNDVAGASYDNWGSGYLYGTKVTMGAYTGTATQMKVYINSPIIDTTVNNKFELAIYNDNAGQPSTPVTNASGQGIVTGAGLNSITFGSPVTLYANTTYWLLYSKNAPGSTTNAAMYSGTGGTNSYYVSWTFGSTPLPNNSCGAPCSQSNYDYSMFVPYTYSDTDGTYSATVSIGADDGKRVWPGDFPNGTFENTVRDTPQGTYYSCPTKRDNYFRFSNITIPPNATINSAYLTITPTTWQQSAIDQNQASIPNFKAELRAELAGNPAAITDDGSPPSGHEAFNFTQKVNGSLTPPVAWPKVGESMGIWNPLIPGANVSPDIRDIIQPLVELGDWNSTNGHINLFWLDTGTGCDGLGNGSGRSGVSYEGQTLYSDGAAPRLTITWTPSALPPVSGCTNPLDTIHYNPLATVDDGSCVILPSTTGACDSKTTNVYCFRTSANQKAFVLWAMLENANDPELYLNANAKCTTLDFDETNNPSSPYLLLGIPTGSPFNYCVKSPQ